MTRIVVLMLAVFLTIKLPCSRIGIHVRVPHARLFYPQISGHMSVYINEPRLSDFKQVLNKAGIQAEFAGGVLICNNVVAVRRVGEAAVFSVLSYLISHEQTTL